MLRKSKVAGAGEDVSPGAMNKPGHERVLLGLVSVATLVVAYAGLSSAYASPEILPPVQKLVAAFASLVTGQASTVGGGHAHPGDHVTSVLEQGVTLQGALLISTLRVLFGIGVGGSIGVLVGFWMGWSRRADEYLHPVYVLFRSIPPLALITYVMLWFGHGEAHLLLPVAYAVFTTTVIPTYHGVRDVADIYVKAARALGARGRFLFSRVIVPAVSPFVLSGLRYALVMAWMTTVGVEMLMGDNGIGHLLVGGGLWSARLEVGVDPAVVMVGILGLAAVGAAMDAAARLVAGRFTAWTRGRQGW
jgi:ABC-type nitrate/sulfonate/bicarbonate transport system permease component